MTGDTAVQSQIKSHFRDGYLVFLNLLRSVFVISPPHLDASERSHSRDWTQTACKYATGWDLPAVNLSLRAESIVKLLNGL